MAEKVGLWIDHRKAVLVSLDEGKATARTIESNVGKRVRSKGGARSATIWGPQDVTYELRRDLKYQGHLNEYYDRVVSAVSGADGLLIMGPGEAKTELAKRLERSGVDQAEVRVETADKLTEAQVIEKTKTHFGYPTRQSFQ